VNRSNGVRHLGEFSTMSMRACGVVIHLLKYLLLKVDSKCTAKICTPYNHIRYLRREPFWLFVVLAKDRVHVTVGYWLDLKDMTRRVLSTMARSVTRLTGWTTLDFPHSSKRSATYTIYCDGPVRKGSLSVDGNHAHASCHKVASL